MIKSRYEAGRRLAQLLMEYSINSEPIVLGVGTGGMPVAFEIAHTLNLPLNMVRTHRFNVPGHRNLVMGAVTSDGSRVSIPKVIREMHIPERVISMVAADGYRALCEEEKSSSKREHISIEGRLTIIVLDGIESGACVHAALSQVREERPAGVIVATGVISQEMHQKLAQEVEGVVSLIRPNPLHSVSDWYESFPPVSEERASVLLRHSARNLAYAR